MKKIILLSALLLFASTAFAVPQYINYQGYLKSPTGEALSGTYTMQFVVYDNPTGGAAVFDSGAQSVAVSNGLYTVKLGTVDSNDFNGDDRWLEVSVGVETLSPRLQIYSAAYALRADAATNTGYATVSGTATTSASADYATVAGTATSAATADYAPLAGSATTAASADYATLTGTATNATTVNHINASTTATANYLYPLDSGGKLAGVPVSAEASSGFALFIDGKLGASSSVVGSDPIAAGDSDKVVSNTAVSANSAVFVMLGPKDYDMGAIWITDISAGSFTVKTTNWAPVGGMPFRYLIIN